MKKDNRESKKIIHGHIRKHAPRAAKKAEKIFRFKYPKLLILIALVILAYSIFNNPTLSNLISNLNNLSYIGIFISGLLLAFGFTAPFSVGFFITSNPPNILIAVLIGGVGASLGDILIFKTIKFSFMNEFEKLKEEKIVIKIKEIVDKDINVKIRHYLLYLFAGILIATPLPDEVGVSMLAGLSTIKAKILWAISFILHSLAIYLILIASS
jgi:hypothetical protein